MLSGRALSCKHSLEHVTLRLSGYLIRAGLILGSQLVLRLAKIATFVHVVLFAPPS